MNSLQGALGVDRWKESSSLLERMRHQYELGCNDCRPSVVTFTQLLLFLADSPEPQAKSNEAERLWTMAKDLRVNFNAYAMHAFLKACNSTKGGDPELRRAFLSAQRVFQESGEQALDGRVYTELLEACYRLVPRRERNKVSESIFKHCVGHGYVNEYVLSKLRKVSPDLYPRLSQQDPSREPTIEAIPAEWKRNVNKDSRRDRN
jgi:hypothetical protein